MVKILGRMLFRGHIQAIEEKSFTLRLDVSGQRIPIGYDQVVQAFRTLKFTMPFR